MPSYQLHKYDPDTGELSIQYGFYQSRAKVQIFGGGFGNGKTTALVMKALRLAKDYPGSNGLLARETFPKLNDTLRKVFLEWCPPEWIKRRPTQEDNTCYLVNGSTVNFRYIAQRGKSAADGSTTSNLLSATYDWVGVDQIEDPGIVEKDFLDMLGRLRGTTTYRPADGEDDPTMPSNGPRWLMVTANPSSGWFFKKVVQPFAIWRDRGIKTENLIVDEETGLPIIDLFEGSTYTNRANLPADYIKSLEAAYRGQQRERFLMGKWAAFEGLVYPDFDAGTHVLTREQIMAHLLACKERHVTLVACESYDFGMAVPSCYLYGFTDDWGRVFLIDGFYKKEFPYFQQPEAMQVIRQRYDRLIKIEKPVIADPAIFRRVVVAGQKVTGRTIASLYQEEGVVMRPGNNDKATGIAKMGAYLTGRIDIPHVITGATPGPLLYVCDELEFFMDEISSYFWRRNPQGQNIDDPIDANDHAMDAARYMLSRLPQPAEIVIPRDQLPPGWMRWHEMSVEDYAQRSRM